MIKFNLSNFTLDAAAPGEPARRTITAKVKRLVKASAKRVALQANWQSHVVTGLLVEEIPKCAICSPTGRAALSMDWFDHPTNYGPAGPQAEPRCQRTRSSIR